MQPGANEQTPLALADRLDDLAKAHPEDGAMYNILSRARDQLRALSWEQFKVRLERADRLLTMRRRHQGYRGAQTGWHTRGGRTSTGERQV
jgi:hypothetical protein